jgi:hypothetical protein
MPLHFVSFASVLSLPTVTGTSARRKASTDEKVRLIRPSVIRSLLVNKEPGSEAEAKATGLGGEEMHSDELRSEKLAGAAK